MNMQDVQAKEIDLKVAKQKLVCAIEEINLKLMNLHYDYLTAEDARCADTQLTQLVKEGAREISKNAIIEARAKERAEIISAIQTALYITSTTAPTYTGLMHAVDIIKARG